MEIHRWISILRGTGWEDMTEILRIRHYELSSLDEKLRVFNRKYIKTIGYDSNNLFTTNWDESDMNRINYYDIYEALYK